MPIKKPWTELTTGNLGSVPKTEGVYEIGDAEGQIIFIAGTPDLRQSLEQTLIPDDPGLGDARYFRYEETFMYTLRESELLQQFIRQNQRLPKCNI